MRASRRLAWTAALAAVPLSWWCMLHADEITGGPGNDNLPGTNAADTIKGEGGNDMIDGKGGNDTLDGGDGNDTIGGGDGEDTIEGGKGADTIMGGPADDTIRGGPGDDNVDGGPGNDDIRGGDGADTIDGGPGNDRIVAGPGLDMYTVAVNNGSDRVTLRAGDVPTDAVEMVRCGSGQDKIKFIGFPEGSQIPGTRDFEDPDTGGIYRIDPDCEGFVANSDFALLDTEMTPSTTCGAPGALVSLKGTEFPPLAAMVVSIAERRAAELKTDAVGAFQVEFKVPELGPGTYRLAVAGARFEEQEYFTVVDRARESDRPRGCAY